MLQTSLSRVPGNALVLSRIDTWVVPRLADLTTFNRDSDASYLKAVLLQMLSIYRYKESDQMTYRCVCRYPNQYILNCLNIP